jgi:hypothetical protein
MFYLHLRSEVARGEIRSRKMTHLTKMDGGYPIKTLERLKECAFCEEKDFLLDYDYSSFLNRMNNIETMAPSNYCELLDWYVDKKNLPINGRKVGGKSCSNPDIDKCVRILDEPREETFTTRRALSLLNRKIPFVCSGLQKFEDGTMGHHANIVYGYEINNKSIPPTVSWKVRDSNHKYTHKSSGNCEKII